MHWRRYLDDPALHGYGAAEVDGWRMVARSDLVEWAVAVARGEVRRVGEVTGGRVPHPRVELPSGGAAVVRSYQRGGLLRHLNRERYFLGHRAFEELRVTVRAAEAGVRVPGPLAAMERRPEGGIGYHARLVTRMVEGAEGLDEVLAAGGEGWGAAVRGAAAQIGRMHGAGITHPDLNLRNVLVRRSVDTSGHPEVYLIDFDRARVLDRPVPAAARGAELRRLARSARKLDVPLGPAQVEALREGYGADWPLPADWRP